MGICLLFNTNDSVKPTVENPSIGICTADLVQSEVLKVDVLGSGGEIKYDHAQTFVTGLTFGVR